MKICFDMDGTIANFYGVPNWLDYLMAKDPTPYEVAEPLLNLSALARQIHRLQKVGYEFVIISWLARNSSADYDEVVTRAKEEWLRKHLPSVEWNEIHIVKYGTPKQTLGNGILFDDEKPNRDAWGLGAYDVDRILEVLRELK